jgi:hypothetical protein
MLVPYQDSQALGNKIAKQVKQQRRLPWLRKRDLIPCSVPLNERAIELVDAIVESTGIPYTMVAMIPTGRGQGAQLKPYIMADGWFIKARADERGIASIDYELDVNISEGYVLVKCNLEMGTGQRFQGVEFKAFNDQSKGITDTVNKAVTQARGKAAFQAVGGVFPGVAEEMQEYEDNNAPVVEKPTKRDANSTPKNGAQLLAQAQQLYKLSMIEVFAALGVTSIASITDMAAAWEKVKEAGVAKGAGTNS